MSDDIERILKKTCHKKNHKIQQQRILKKIKIQKEKEWNLNTTIKMVEITKEPGAKYVGKSRGRFKIQIK